MVGQLEKILENLLFYHEENPLFYTNISFWIGFTFFLGIFSIVYRHNKIRNIYLLIISWFIYSRLNGAFLLLLIFSCFMNYGFGLMINHFRKSKIWLIVSVAANLFVLGYFKYAYFFVDVYSQLVGKHYVVFNWVAYFLDQIKEGIADTHSILLPIGISFYTFQAISYLVDVYRKKADVVRNVLDFSFYLSFFPQLVAGPIVRAASFIPQLYQKYKLTREEFGHAIFIITKGFFKKLVIADFLAINFVDRVFDSPLSFSGIENLLAVYGYSIQIYCDFSGYTDIAIGLALILGFKIPINFNAPYHATSLTDFWHRWHISLSLWLKDYLYIPLGGNRKSKIRTYSNIMITMLLGGLWHGANVKFLIWGGIHGIGLIVEKFFRGILKPKSIQSKLQRLIAIFVTFQVVSFSWLFFRAKNRETIFQFFNQIRYHLIPKVTVSEITAYLPTIGIFLLGLLFIWVPFRLKEKIRGWFIGMPAMLQIIVVVIALLLISYIAKSGLQPFIYFRF